MAISIGGGINIGGGISFEVIPPDPYFANVSLLLPGTGTNASLAVVNYSENNFAVDVAGNAQISTAQSKWGDGSIYLDGVGDYLVSSNTVLEANTTFTLDTWVYVAAFDAVQPSGIFFSGTTSADTQRIQLGINPNGSVFFYMESTTGVSNSVTSAAGVVTAGSWAYLAVVRNGSLVTLYVNGVSVATLTITVSITLTTNTYIGFVRSGAALRYLNGYLNDFRVTNGVARYTTNFDPPTAPLLLPDVVPVQYLIVAGGGGTNGSGDQNSGNGGGGGGGLLYQGNYSLSQGTPYTITVGSGGTLDSNGGNSSMVSETLSTVSTGGGRGGVFKGVGAVGGSGGGGGGRAGTAGGAGTAGQGNTGGNARTGDTAGASAGGGGGGAGAVGSNGTTGSVGGAGGAGLAYNFAGTSLFYAAGGGAQGSVGGGAGGSSGVGGVGGAASGNSGNGLTNRGGGGGGKRDTASGGLGGSGVVIIRYPDNLPAALTTGSPTISATSGYRVYTFTGSGSITF